MKHLRIFNSTVEFEAAKSSIEIPYVVLDELTGEVACGLLLSLHTMQITPIFSTSIPSIAISSAPLVSTAFRFVVCVNN